MSRSNVPVLFLSYMDPDCVFSPLPPSDAALGQKSLDTPGLKEPLDECQSNWQRGRNVTTRLRVLECSVLPILKYGCETWTVLKKLKRKYKQQRCGFYIE